MKNYLSILVFAAISFCLICGGCQSDNVVEDESAAAQPNVEEAETVKTEVNVKVEIAAEPKAPAVVEAKPPTRPTRTTRARRWRLYGDWEVKVDYDSRQMESILSFSRDREGNQTGQWISFWGVNELKDIKFEDDKLSYVQTYQGRDGQTMTSTFAGTVEDGKISGTISSDRGEYKLTGQRSRRTPRAVGNWELKMKMGEREFTSTLVITADEAGELGAEWQSEWGEHEITDVKYERRKLTFNRKSKMQDRQWESTFDGTLGRDTLSGVIKSERGEITVEGTRVGAALIGNWNLEVTSERGTRKQRLKVNPDMSGMYGAIPVEKVNLEGDKVSFKTVLEFGERTFEMSFEGKLEESKLTGQLTTSRGTREVTGTKVIRSFRRRRTR
jgi:hypothetical protein